MKDWDFDQEFKQLRIYLAYTSSAIDDNQRQFFDRINEQNKGMTDDELSEHNEVTLDFPRLLYSSFVITWYAFVEHQLLEICRRSNLRISISIDDNERYGEGINRVYNFLLKACDYRISDDTWQELKRIGRVRNQIVHNNGKINFPDEATDGEIQKYVKVKDRNGLDIYLSIDSDFYNYLRSYKIIQDGSIFYINPDYKFCRHLIGFAIDMLKKVDRDLIELSAK